MKKLIEVDITGTLQVPFELSTYFDLENYLYYKKNHQTIEAVTTIKFDDTTAYFPRNLEKFIKSIKEPDKFKIKFHNKTVTNPANISVSDTFSLLDRQKEPTRQMLELLKTKSQCILQAPPSWGKSYSLAHIVKELGQKSLILVDKTLLADQMYKEFKNNTKDTDISLLSSKNKKLGDVNIATLQFLLKNNDLLEQLSKEIGLVVQDECVTGDTEIFTEKGWVRFDELDKSTKVAQVNPDTLEYDFVMPTRYIKRFSKLMCGVKTDKYKIESTAGHNHLIKDTQTGNKLTGSIKWFPNNFNLFNIDGTEYEFRNSKKYSYIYNDYVYCVEVPTHYIYVKQNGLSYVTGNCHSISIGAFTDVIHSIPARYRLGLSATPTRSDGLTEAIYDALGYHKVIATNPDNLDVDIYSHHIPISAYGEDYHTFLFNLYTHRDFLKRLVKLVTIAVKNKRQVLLYTTSQSIQVFYQELFKQFKPLLLNSNSTQKKKNEILEKFDKRESPILISGTSVTKGVSIYTLDTIINCAFNTKENLEQLIGRLRRNDDNKKKPVFITFSFDSAYKQGQKQEKILRNLVKPTNDTFNKVGKFGDLVEVLEA
jgi:superfamily II DNA or RNA helicase